MMNFQYKNVIDFSIPLLWSQKGGGATSSDNFSGSHGRNQYKYLGNIKVQIEYGKSKCDLKQPSIPKTM